MPRVTQRPKETSLNLRIDAGLKAAFAAATEADDKPAAQVVREFMRTYVRRRQRIDFEVEARKQSKAIAERAHDPRTDEYAVMREIAAEFDAEGPDTWPEA